MSEPLNDAALVAAFSSSSALAPDLSGSYQVTGTTPDGGVYEGVLDLEKVGDDVYSMRWDVGAIYLGTGVYKDGYLAAGYASEDDKFSGVSLYAVEGSETLRGSWTAYGAVALGTELAQR